MAVQVAIAAARFVFMYTRLAFVRSASVDIAVVLAPLNPNQQNQRMKTPSAATVRL